MLSGGFFLRLRSSLIDLDSGKLTRNANLVMMTMTMMMLESG